MPPFPTLSRFAVPVIVAAELLGTSVWFSANAAFDDLARAWGLGAADLGLLTTAVQLGFIAGTFAFSLSGFADRHAASRIFAASALVAAVSNAAFAFAAGGIATAAALRFVTGFAIAGVYPLGMKLVVGWEPRRAGEALAWLLAMLTLGTALPHAVRAMGASWPWPWVVGTSSVLACIAAGMVFALGDGPHLPKPQPGDSRGATALRELARVPAFRASALGYFGHMWELYAMWTVAPLLVAQALKGTNTQGPVAIAWGSFFVIAVGAAGCIAGGHASRRLGGARVAAAALAGSALAGAAWPFVAGVPTLAFPVLLFWGVAIVADSPQFSALSAAAAPRHLVGSALAIQNSVGFAITVVSISLATAWIGAAGPWIAWLLVPGPVLGLLGLMPLLRTAGSGR